MKTWSVLALVLLANGSFAADTRQTVDFPGFLELSSDALALRESRLIDIEAFNRMAAEADTLILDTRSRFAYERRHLRGAVHLNLSDMTEGSLQRVLGSRDRRVLIYCNNNFLNDPQDFARKAPPAALNIPTFATLFIYNYRNVFELSSLLDVGDPRLSFEGTAVSPASDSAP